MAFDLNEQNSPSIRHARGYGLVYTKSCYSTRAERISQRGLYRIPPKVFIAYLPKPSKYAEYSTESLLQITHGTQRVARTHTILAMTALYLTAFITTARSTLEPHSTPPASLRIVSLISPSTGRAVYTMRRRPKLPASATSTISSSQFSSCCCTTLASSTSISTFITVTVSSKPSGLQIVL